MTVDDQEGDTGARGAVRFGPASDASGPVDQDREGPGGRDRAAQAPPRLLVVDDDEFVLSCLRRALRGVPCTLTLIGSPEEGLAAYADLSPDLVLVDLCMPRMDGLEFLARALEGHDGPVPQVYLHSAVSPPPATREAIARLGYGLVDKDDMLERGWLVERLARARPASRSAPLPRASASC